MLFEVGETAKRLTELFDFAHEIGRTVIFLDKVDSLFGMYLTALSYNTRLAYVESAHGDQTTYEPDRDLVSGLSRKLGEIDRREGDVIFICATNHPENLDPALLRRLKVLSVPLPNLAERTEIFEIVNSMA